jgi:alpha-tubulin suppressor-like RCC1 family protein
VTAVSGGGGYTCALLSTGGVKCWGDNTDGRLGNGSASEPQNLTEPSSTTPVGVTGLSSGVSAIATGYNVACALTLAGAVECWGGNENGELGNGTTMDKTTLTNIYSTVPVQVSGMSGGVTAIAAGKSFACALTSGGGVKCWGDNSIYGELGDGSTTSSPTPVNVVGLSSGVTAITAGLDFACALISGGAVKCWGNGGDVFGIGSYAHPTPVSVTDSALSSGVKSFSAGRNFVCAISAGGGVRCLGGYKYGQLGTGSTAPGPGISADVSGLTSGVAAIAAGGQFACALTVAGGVKCWGDGYGFTPVDVSSLTSGVTVLAAGWSNACAVTTASGVECWGGSSSTGVSSPAEIPGL